MATSSGYSVRAEAAPWRPGAAVQAPATGEAIAHRALPALLALVPIFGLAAAQGGYFPTSWGWASVALAGAAALALVIRREINLSRGERIFVAALATLLAWCSASIAWSDAPAATVLDVERFLVYLTFVVALLLTSRRGSARYVLGGAAAATAAITVFSLATRVLPDRVGVFDGTGVYRLAQPIGYWNGLALFTSMGAILAATFAARARSVAYRAVCGATLVFFLPTLYFTFSRGAWIALAFGLVVAVTLDPRRLQFLAVLLVLAPAVVTATLASAREPALTHLGATLPRAAHEGHRLAGLLLVLAAVNAALSAAFAIVERRVVVAVALRRAFAASLAVIVVLASISVFVRYGGPITLAQKGYAAFNAPLVNTSRNLNERLFSFSGNDRAQLWRIAWDDARANPVVGSGAGTYERYFLAHQPRGVALVRDAHNLYLETLAELGHVGLALLALALAVPLAALRSTRAHPLVPGAAGVFSAYVLHAGADWDWELPAVTLVALTCGCFVLLTARQFVRVQPVAPIVRWSGVVALFLAAAVAAVGLFGNLALSRSDAARARGDQEAAARDAHVAQRWMPWSPEPWQALGRAARAAGHRREATRAFRKAISLDARDWRSWYELATVARGRERTKALRQLALLYRPLSDAGSADER